MWSHLLFYAFISGMHRYICKWAVLSPHNQCNRRQDARLYSLCNQIKTRNLVMSQAIYDFPSQRPLLEFFEVFSPFITLKMQHFFTKKEITPVHNKTKTSFTCENICLYTCYPAFHSFNRL